MKKTVEQDVVDILSELTLGRGDGDDARRSILALIATQTTEAYERGKREGIQGLHDSIMRHELPLGQEPDQAFNYARIHHWIDAQASPASKEPADE